jgi:hypothetical protein
MKQTLKTFEEVQALIDGLMEEKKYAIDIQELGDNAGYIVNWQETKMYTAMDGKEYPDEFWITKDNDMLLVQDISPEHCRNILRLLLRNNREMEVAMSEFRAHLVEVVAGAVSPVGEDNDNDDIPGGNYIVPPAPHTLH